MANPLRIALIGTGFMGRMHAQAWRTAHRFFDLPLEPELTVVVGRDADRTARAARTLGAAEQSTDWSEVIGRADVDLVDICTPGDTHAAIAVAALEAGLHVLCEKPLANDVAEAERMAQAAGRALDRGVVSMCGFSYRRTPALALARRLVAEGRIGQVRHVRAQYLQDWLSDPDAPFTWRLDSNRAGSGALGDIGAHSIDTAQWLTGDHIEGVSATMRTFVDTRPLLGEQVGLGGRAERGGPRERVTVDDAVAFTAQFATGALGVFEATRMATGRRNANRIELNGDRRSLAFDFERMNELELSVPYSQRLQTTDNRNGTWTLASGSLPNGLVLPRDTITGTPIQAQTSTFQILFTDTANLTARKTLNIVIGPASPGTGYAAYAWGSNFYGELGDGTATTRWAPLGLDRAGVHP